MSDDDARVSISLVDLRRLIDAHRRGCTFCSSGRADACPERRWINPLRQVAL